MIIFYLCYILVVIFYKNFLADASLVQGNGNLVRTYRPVTSFNKIIFGQSNSNNINSLLPIEVNIKLSTQDGQDTISQFDNMIEYDETSLDSSELDDKQGDELILDCDQNLQKYFMIESNGDYLNIRFEDASLAVSDSEVNKTKGRKNDDDDDVMKNLIFLNSSNPIRFTVKTKQTFMFINKRNFSSQVNLNFEPPSSKYHIKKSYLKNKNENSTIGEEQPRFKNANSTVVFDCSGVLSIDEHHVRTDIFNVRKLRTRSNIYLDYLNLSICDESFSFYVYHKMGFNELVAMRNK